MLKFLHIFILIYKSKEFLIPLYTYIKSNNSNTSIEKSLIKIRLEKIYKFYFI